MSKPSHALLLATALALGIGAPAGAATLSGSTLGISIGALPPITLGQSTDPVTLAVAGDGSFNNPASLFGPSTVVLPRALFTGVPLIQGLTIAGLANGAISVTPSGGPGGGFGGVGPLAGDTLVNALSLFNLTIPLSVVGANSGATVMVSTGGIFITVIGGPWGTGPQVLTGVTTDTPGTAVLHTVTFAGSDGRTAGFQRGPFTLVSAFKAITSTSGNLPGLATQSMRFVPEPAGALLLVVGGGVLGYAASRRLRRP